MGTAIISGLFAVVLACLAWGLQNGSRRARLLTRIERYTQILKDLPHGHPARAHLDAALAAEAEQLRDLTGSQAPQLPAPGYQYPSYAPAPLPDGPYGPDPGPATMDDIFGPGEENPPVTPSAPPPLGPNAPSPAPPSKPTPTPPPTPRPARSKTSLQTYASLALGLLAGGFAIFAIWLIIDQLLG